MTPNPNTAEQNSMKRKRPPLTKRDIKFNSSENFDQTHCATHALYSSDMKDHMGIYTGETHKGNSALCNWKYGISEDGDSYLTIDQVPEDSTYERCCKRCQKIYDKLPD